MHSGSGRFALRGASGEGAGKGDGFHYKYRIKLSGKEKQVLRQAKRKGRKDARLVLRILIIVWADKGQTIAHTAELLGCCEQTVLKWRKRFLQCRSKGPVAALLDLPRSGRPGTEQRYSNFGFELVGEIVRRVSGKSLDDFARERLFEPLGMKDTSYSVPESASHRVVKRPADGPLAVLNSREFQETPSAAIGAYSTAMDMAVFGQMFLNRGIYGDAWVLSPVTVAEMTRNQIPGISSWFVDEVFPEAGTGFSWFIRENKKVVAYGETLQSAKTFCHGGAGGVFLWIDPVYEVVGCYFSVDIGPITVAEWRRYMRADLFINAVMAAVIDV